jgi:eukaryotic-like serine/threonine-protein kinase
MGINIQGRVLLNQFRVDAFLANGGTGAVYRVWDLQRSTPLAMKVLNTDIADDPVLYKSFEREAHSLRELSHPHIVPFYGLYQTMDFAFILERFIDGPTLKEVLKRTPGQPLAIKDIFTYMKALCAALGYAHSKGIVHCDVKPANVMIDRGGAVFLTDFGVARYTESTTTTLAGAGTPAYMAPEQILAHNVSPATDVYALGVTMFELLVGRRPFLGNETGTESAGATNNERIRFGHLNLNPPDPRQFNPSIPEELALVLLRSMAKEPEQRFQSTQEFFLAFCTALKISPGHIPERVSLPQDFFSEDPGMPQAAFPPPAASGAYANFANPNGAATALGGMPDAVKPAPGANPPAKPRRLTAPTILMMVGAFVVVASVLAVLISGAPVSIGSASIGSTSTADAHAGQKSSVSVSVVPARSTDTLQPSVAISATPTLVPTVPPPPPIPTTPVPVQPVFDLAFSSNQGGGTAFQIVLMDSRSGETRKLAIPSGYDKVFWPSLCGDMVFGEAEVGSEQWIYFWSASANKDGTRWAPPTSAPRLGVPRCSPNANYLAFTDMQTNALAVLKVIDISKNKEIFSMPPDKISTRHITGYATWSSNNQDFFSMFYIQNNSKNEALYTIIRTNGFSGYMDVALTKTKANETIESAYYPELSPDGKLMSFGCRIGGKANLCLYNFGTGQSKILTGLSSKTFPGLTITGGASAWSKDGQWVYFTSADSGNYDIYRIHSDGSGRQNITDGWGTDEIMPATLW